MYTDPMVLYVPCTICPCGETWYIYKKDMIVRCW